MAGEIAMVGSRRKFLGLATGAATIAVFPRAARAQSYPERAVRIVVGYAAGGTADIAARLIAQSLSERLGRPFVVENRPGAGNNIATEAVLRAPPDGHTLLLANSANAVNETLYQGLSFNFLRDAAPVAGILRSGLAMVIAPSLPVKTVLEFVTYAKSNPGKINMGSGGNGTAGHIAGEMFKMMAGVDMVHVPYRAAPAVLTDVLGGRVQVYFGLLPGTIEHINTGKLRALAVTTSARSESLPDVAPLGDFVPGYEASAWQGIAAPANTPVDLIDKLHKAVNEALVEPTMAARFADLGGAAMRLSPTEFGTLISDETEKWRRVIKFAGIKP
jgi:tripartite-type tricarboxylate transporter receptor subunit TctC